MEKLTQHGRVITMLKQAGAKGVVTGQFLHEGLYEFRSRICELRGKGWNITKAIRLSASSFKYILKKPYIIK